MRVAIIGMGSIGQRHQRNAEALGHLVHCVDTDIERGIPLLQNVVANSDAVLICTPASTHTDVALQLLALNYRGPLFCEKPLALSAADCDVFLSWPHQVTMVGYNWRWHPPMRWVLQQPVSWLHFVCHTDISAWPGVQYAAPLLECSHEIDLALSLGAKLSHVGTYIDGCWLQFTNPSALIDVYWRSDRHERRLTARGLRFNSDGLMPLGKELDQSYRDELEHFLACVERSASTECPFAAGIRVLAVCNQAEQMARSARA